MWVAPTVFPQTVVEQQLPPRVRNIVTIGGQLSNFMLHLAQYREGYWPRQVADAKVGAMGFTELLVLIAVVVVAWNIRRLPEIFGSARKTTKAFKEGLKEEKPSEPRDVTPPSQDA